MHPSATVVFGDAYLIKNPTEANPDRWVPENNMNQFSLFFRVPPTGATTMTVRGASTTGIRAGRMWPMWMGMARRCGPAPLVFNIPKATPGLYGTRSELAGERLLGLEKRGFGRFVSLFICVHRWLCWIGAGGLEFRRVRRCGGQFLRVLVARKFGSPALPVIGFS